MRVVVVGATGLVGRALLPRLRAEGHQVIAQVRSAARARQRLGDDVALLEEAPGSAAFTAALGDVDAVVNLAGEPIVGVRWTDAKKRAIRASRVEVTAAVAQAMASATPRRRVLVQTSGVNYYGSRGDEELDESSAAGDDFLARLCIDWEGATEPAARAGVRVVRMRLGVILAPRGGALDKMRPIFQLGLGGRLGSGQSFLSWIHLDDVVAVFASAAADERYAGAFNATAPAPVRNREFTRALAGSLRRPAIVPAPAFAIRALFGEAAEVVLGSQRALPRHLLELGYRFAYPEIDAALRAVAAARAAGEG